MKTLRRSFVYGCILAVGMSAAFVPHALAKGGSAPSYGAVTIDFY